MAAKVDLIKSHFQLLWRDTWGYGHQNARRSVRDMQTSVPVQYFSQIRSAASEAMRREQTVRQTNSKKLQSTHYHGGDNELYTHWQRYVNCNR